MERHALITSFVESDGPKVGKSVFGLFQFVI